MEKTLFLLLSAALALSAADDGILGGFKVSGNRMNPVGKNRLVKPESTKIQVNENYITLDGFTHGITIVGSETLDCEKGMTAVIKCRWRTMPGNNELFRKMDALIFKDDQFAFMRQDDRIYINFFNGQKWKGVVYSSNILPKPDDARFHTLVMTVKRHYLVDQGEDWIEVQGWLDGKVAVSRKLPHYRIHRSAKPVELGSGLRFGRCWDFGGDIAEAYIIPKVLGPAEIRKISNWQKPKIVRPAGKKIAMKGKNSILTLLSAPGYVHPVSFYDAKVKRELLADSCKMFSVTCQSGKKWQEVSPLSPGMKSFLLRPPKQKDGVWTFSIGCRKEAVKDSPVTFSAVCDYRYWNDRLEYSLKISGTANGRIQTVSYPDVHLNPLKAGRDFLLVPQMCGVVHPDAAARNAGYSEMYPRGMASMQLGAYYDSRGGVYISTGDPKGHVKILNFSASEDQCEALTQWDVHDNRFDIPCRAALELFRGDWYDAGLIYRAEQARNNSMWWRKTLPETDTPEWMRNATWSMSVTIPYFPEDQIIRLRNYFESPPTLFIWGWWEEGGTSLAPTIRATPEIIEFYRAVQKHGVRVTPYINGRLWAKFDHRGRSREYETVGLPAAVINNGAPAAETYPSIPTVVLCPSTKTYRERIPQLALKIMAQGADGVYVDQVGAAAAKVCTSDKHDHRPGDLKFWYTNGHYPTYMAIRKDPRAKGKILSTEDHSETCVRIFDTMLPWRWLYENMVPLFPMVFSGRTQFYGRDSAGIHAPYTKTAWMLANGEQMGNYNHILLSPLMDDFRRFLKRMIHTRTALLPFFNEGMMARPPRFTSPVPVEKEYWGVHGDKYITMPKIISSFWQLQKERALLLVNTGTKPLKTSLELELPAGKYRAAVFSSFAEPREYPVRDGKYACTLPGRGNQVVWFYPEGQCSPVRKAEFERCFRTIRKTLTESNPFPLDLKQKSWKGKIRTPWNWLDTGDCYLRIGAQKQPGGGLYWIANGIIGIGKIDFGTDQCKGFEMELVRLSSFSSPGTIRFCLDGIAPEQTVAEFKVNDRNVVSANPKDWKTVKIELKRPVSGTHFLYIVFNGFSFCNAKNWRAVK